MGLPLRPPIISNVGSIRLVENCFGILQLKRKLFYVIRVPALINNYIGLHQQHVQYYDLQFYN